MCRKIPVVSSPLRFLSPHLGFWANKIYKQNESPGIKPSFSSFLGLLSTSFPQFMELIKKITAYWNELARGRMPRYLDMRTSTSSPIFLDLQSEVFMVACLSTSRNEDLVRGWLVNTRKTQGACVLRQGHTCLFPNLVPRCRDPFGQRRGSRPLASSSDQFQHRKSAIHGLPVTLRMLTVTSDKSH